MELPVCHVNSMKGTVNCKNYLPRKKKIKLDPTVFVTW
jgi:hypothetical protein